MTLPFVIPNSVFDISSTLPFVILNSSFAIPPAFRGELVPQDPKDEPASALLERLRSQPASPTTKPARKVLPVRIKH